MIKMKLVFLFFLMAWLGASAQEFGYANQQFKSYWYVGKAEIASYELQQARYGEMHDGHAVLIFVTEDFSKSKQVKLDNPSANGDDKVNVMKLNFMKKFLTGIYPYSMMTSVFTPVMENSLFPLKITNSSQEWCGQTFAQMNYRNEGYLVKDFSYFEKEGDRIYRLGKVIPEDDIWNLIRINPELLPVGKLKMIPGVMTSRLKHYLFEALEVEATLEVHDDTAEYVLYYPETERKLIVRFEKHFPFRILGWEETYKAAWGGQEKFYTTTARLIDYIHTDYWNQNKNKDEMVREELGLP
ncbi:MAG: hypothetical protein K9G67_04720 [Bacteroidales bacterium]|nr:hypothetical protein [Bacteroidales bacterium]MCF8350882.1 hypothetical protein [Bacteroidales bacterium]MCF8375636.1 hypothetical protein [Bacteroidales bacterium]MCF8400781.1 hypothetical protein [Bacteroidales bacterium]